MTSMISKVNNKYILDPTNCPQEWDWGKWQKSLKYACECNQSGFCPICKECLGGRIYDLHHALMTRQDIMKLKESWRIHHTYNCLVLCRDCHTNATKEKCAEILYSLYGKPVVQWYENFPVKYNKPNLFFKKG